MGKVKDELLFQMLHDYLKKYLPDQKYASPNTVKAYRTALNQFFEYVVQVQPEYGIYGVSGGTFEAP